MFILGLTEPYWLQFIGTQTFPIENNVAYNLYVPVRCLINCSLGIKDVLWEPVFVGTKGRNLWRQAKGKEHNLWWSGNSQNIWLSVLSCVFVCKSSSTNETLPFLYVCVDALCLYKGEGLQTCWWNHHLDLFDSGECCFLIHSGRGCWNHQQIANFYEICRVFKNSHQCFTTCSIT